MSTLKKPLIIIFLILIIDQVVKIWIKTHMMIGEEIPVFGNWFIIHFIENNGMAFGKQLPGEGGKLFLSVFRIIAIFGIGYYLYNLTKKKAPKGLIISISLVLAGAIGNIIDSVFYGQIFTESYGRVAEIFPAGGGYAPFLHGKVVDMLYFPLLEGHFPEWLPLWGGEDFIFFRPVFNIADSAITVGIFIIILFRNSFFPKEEKK